MARLDEAWWDHYKLWSYSFEQDPLSKRTKRKDVSGAGVNTPEAIPDIRQDGSFWGGGGGMLRLRDTAEFVDLSTITSRASRYKEYERLRNVAEIESAMTIIADEACVSGKTPIATFFHGYRTIEWLAKNYTEPFLVYCWDFGKNDYTLGWAYDPRFVKREKTVKVLLDDGSDFIVTYDHKILKKSGEWVAAGELRNHDELMPFYKLEPHRMLNTLPNNLFPRIFTFHDGWKSERQFADEWKTGDKDPKADKVNRICKMLAGGMSVHEVSDAMGHEWLTMHDWVKKAGFTLDELRWLGKKKSFRKVVGMLDWHEQDVYDLSVKDHRNFCTDTVVMHNCQIGDNNHVLQLECKNHEIIDKLSELFFHRSFLNLDRNMWNIVKKLCIFGDYFAELIIDSDSPKTGILKMLELPADSVYRIETTKGRLVEFQQSAEGPDLQSLSRPEVTRSTEQELMQSNAIRFTANQIVHMKIGDDRKTFYPYGQSLIEPARGPAHQLRLMEDAMVVYRLTRAPERRVFYIDVGQLPPYRAEAFMEKLKDQLKKKKVGTDRGTQGASSVEERWHAPAADEDFWLPVRPNSSTRIDTLPGAQNLGEIDDALYFRNKLFTALNFPRSYLANEDPNTTRITLSAQDGKFARMVQRIQNHVLDGIYQIAERHLDLLGIPIESYEDLVIKMTKPSHWEELSEAEVKNARLNQASTYKSSMLYSDFDIMVDILKVPESKAQEYLSRLRLQKLEEAQLQIMVANPEVAGIGVPGQGENEIGVDGQGPNPMLGEEPPGGAPPPDAGGPAPTGPEGGGGEGPAPQAQGAPLPEITPEEIKKYDLEFQSYNQEKDHEDIDYSTL